MTFEQAVKQAFRCRACHEPLEKIRYHYGCTNGNCYQNDRRLDYLKKLNKMSRKHSRR